MTRTTPARELCLAATLIAGPRLEALDYRDLAGTRRAGTLVLPAQERRGRRCSSPTGWGSSGHTLDAGVVRDDERLQYDLGYFEASPGYVQRAGFYRRPDVRRVMQLARYLFRPQGGPVAWWGPKTYLHASRDFSGRRLAELLVDRRLADLPHNRKLNGDFLITYLVSPGTALYVGYNGDLQNYDPSLRGRRPRRAPAHREGVDPRWPAALRQGVISVALVRRGQRSRSWRSASPACLWPARRALPWSPPRRRATPCSPTTPRRPSACGC
ncbi:MAG TPA: hypothetical protein VGV61_19555 [Thermoanaerobaculia bacterium]|nr:hypothetical protein [Thermoanaerobaculia bacterium]